MKAIYLGVLALVASFALLLTVTVDANGWHSALIGWATFFGFVLFAAGISLIAFKAIP